MKKIFYLSLAALLLLMSGVLVGVRAADPDKTPGKTPEKAPEKTPEKTPDKTEVSPARQAKDEAVTQAQTELQALAAKIQAADAKSDQAEAAEQAALKTKINDLKNEYSSSIIKLEALKNAEEKDWKKAEKDLDDSVGKLKGDYRALLSSSKLYAEEVRAEYVSDAQERLAAADKKAEELAAKAEQTSGKDKAALEKEAAELKTNIAAAKTELANLEKSKVKDWEGLKENVDKALDKVDGKHK